MILSEQDYIDFGNTYGLAIPIDEPKLKVQDDKDFEDCDH